MPKKFGGNTKAIEAREKKEAVKNAEKERKEKEVEDAMWKDEDKHVMRKQQRKEDNERKKQEQQEKKLARKSAYDEEMDSLKSTKSAIPAKVTRADIACHVEKSSKSVKSEKTLRYDEEPLVENVNHLETDGDVARNVDEAIAVLSLNNEKVDLHPEKRVKAAYMAYEERNLPQLKLENPNLRLSQLKQMLKKDWMKSSENPLNQR